MTGVPSQDERRGSAFVQDGAHGEETTSAVPSGAGPGVVAAIIPRAAGTGVGELDVVAPHASRSQVGVDGSAHIDLERLRLVLEGRKLEGASLGIGIGEPLPGGITEQVDLIRCGVVAVAADHRATGYQHILHLASVLFHCQEGVVYDPREEIPADVDHAHEAGLGIPERQVAAVCHAMADQKVRPVGDERVGCWELHAIWELILARDQGGDSEAIASQP